MFAVRFIYNLCTLAGLLKNMLPPVAAVIDQSGGAPATPRDMFDLLANGTAATDTQALLDEASQSHSAFHPASLNPYGSFQDALQRTGAGNSETLYDTVAVTTDNSDVLGTFRGWVSAQAPAGGPYPGNANTDRLADLIQFCTENTLS